MATVAQVATASLKKILVEGAETELDPADFSDWIQELNFYMLDLDANGIQLGFTEVSSLGDEITVPTGALRGIISNVAIESAAAYNGAISPALQRAANEGLKTMRLLGKSMGASRYPGTLPLGSGNEGDFSFGLSSHFFPDLEAEILAETTGCISLETDTNTVAEGG